ncbi:MAG: Xaa-Pro peptidase family protein [Trueperaceae bacterium]
MSALVALQRRMTELAVDALLITDPANVRYLSGFTTPTDGRLLLTSDGSWLVTDRRYQAQAAEESRIPVEIRRDWVPWVGERVGRGRLGVEAESLTVALYEELSGHLGGAPLALRGLLRDRRMIKDAVEQEKLRLAARITDHAFDHILGFMREGLSEVDVALELERAMRTEGAEAKSFDIVVASGNRSEMPHGVASPKRLERGELVTLDFGAMVGGYHADMTRSVAIGELSDELRALYDAVLEAEQAALAAARPGVTGHDLDAVARAVLAHHRLEQYFAHSLGHGVGLEIHEGPKVARDSTDVLEPGMAVTIEPGVYVAGVGGLRIEDLVLITSNGNERLSLAPTELITV